MTQKFSFSAISLCAVALIAPLARGADLVVHEATNAFLPPYDDPAAGYEGVRRLTAAHGHSTPQMAGEFARKCGARRLALTHFSPRYHGDARPESVVLMQRIERDATNSSQLEPEVRARPQPPPP